MLTRQGKTSEANQAQKRRSLPLNNSVNGSRPNHFPISCVKSSRQNAIDSSPAVDGYTCRRRHHSVAAGDTDQVFSPATRRKQNTSPTVDELCWSQNGSRIASDAPSRIPTRTRKQTAEHRLHVRQKSAPLCTTAPPMTTAQQAAITTSQNAVSRPRRQRRKSAALPIPTCDVIEDKTGNNGSVSGLEDSLKKAGTRRLLPSVESSDVSRVRSSTTSLGSTQAVLSVVSPNRKTLGKSSSTPSDHSSRSQPRRTCKRASCSTPEIERKRHKSSCRTPSAPSAPSSDQVVLTTLAESLGTASDTHFVDASREQRKSAALSIPTCDVIEDKTGNNGSVSGLEGSLTKAETRRSLPSVESSDASRVCPSTTPLASTHALPSAVCPDHERLGESPPTSSDDSSRLQPRRTSSTSELARERRTSSSRTPSAPSSDQVEVTTLAEGLDTASDTRRESLDSVSDDDLPEMLCQESEEGPICQWDIIWLKMRAFPFWPAVVRHVYRQKKRIVKLSICFIGDGSRLSVTYNKANVLPFGCSQKRHADIKSEGERSSFAVKFNAAVQKVEDFFLQRACHHDVNVRDFFADDLGIDTDSGTDLISAPTELESPFACLDNTCQSDDRLSSSEQDSANGSAHEGAVDSLSIETPADGDGQLPKKVKRRINNRRLRNEKLVELIKSSATKAHLEKISRGEVDSWRHRRFNQKCLNRVERQQLKRLAGPFDNDEQQDEVLLTVAAFNNDFATANSMSYVIDVLVPEATIFAMSKALRLTIEQAEKRYSRGIKRSKEEIASIA